MPKMKTKRAASKRFSKTASGRIKRRQKGMRHILTKYSRNTKRKLRKSATVHPADAPRIEKTIPYA